MYLKVTGGSVPIDGGYDTLIPQFIKVRQVFDSTMIDDIQAKIRDEVQKKGIRVKIKPGMRIAVGVGSRGIANLGLIVRCLIDELQNLGAKPFIVPAMGSHGGATAEGQAKYLKSHGISQQSMGVPIHSSMDVIHIGNTSSGVPVLFDKICCESDLVIIVARVKPHTDFKGPIESGLCKMLAIGLGKHAGASRLHKEGFEEFHHVIPEAAKVILNKVPVAFGLAVIENAYDQTAFIEAVEASQFLEREPILLDIAKSRMPRLYFDDLDVLIVQEIGKNISGAGMDPNITGRSGSMVDQGFIAPTIQRIVALNLTNETHGNASGIGLADVTTKHLVNSIDFPVTYANGITSTVPSSCNIPLVMNNDKEAIVVAMKTCNRIRLEEIKMVWIRNTLSLEHIWVSESLIPFVKSRTHCQVCGEPQFIKFSDQGHMIPFE
ncbi:nickel pincer cofactor-dependent isomerase, group 22 [Alicyclobacillus dauci]|uniref:Nickel-dependent lactate racemase n=1 Tax=Alicyclobacillus dauci TaxID=1475485 RepID=A0ABY6Z1B5_9BACL|nr:lactate racemase domain-containing protein [Alicyclobacillus dauci]WAH35765.1 nickel-dependent lactate racemase [Alicyclobacillus dauci]